MDLFFSSFHAQVFSVRLVFCSRYYSQGTLRARQQLCEQGEVFLDPLVAQRLIFHRVGGAARTAARALERRYAAGAEREARAREGL